MGHGFSTQDVQIIFASDLTCAKLLKPVRYVAVDGTVYEIPYAQPTDFASIPNAFWGAPLFLIPTGWYSLPALGHDSAFQNLLLIVQTDGTKVLANLPEEKCNALLLEMMQAIKPDPTAFEKAQMEAIYWGVTLGGWHAFKADRS